MEFNNIYEIFKNRKSKPIGKYKRSAVMIILMEEEGEIYVLFEVRSLNLKSQPGDVCLPGGKVEFEESPKKAAFRETFEEINVNREELKYIGDMDFFITPYETIIYPFVCKLLTDKNMKINKKEVDHLFKVPINFFMKYTPLHYEMKIGPMDNRDFPYHLINKGKDYKFAKGILDESLYIYKDYVIWGFTARVIKSFMDIIKGKDYENR